MALEINNTTVIVFDNGGESFDRFTIILQQTGDMWGASENPYHPQGFGMYVGNAAQDRLKVEYPNSWQFYSRLKHCIKRTVRDFVKEARHNIKWLGKEVTEPVQLPNDVLKFINHIVS